MPRLATLALCAAACCPGASIPATPPEGAGGADLAPTGSYGPGPAPAPVPPPAPSAVSGGSEACTDDADCASGICEGVGCGTPDGRCVDKDRPCTADIQPYCGCDHMTFTASGSCAGRRYAHKGRCEDVPD
jgi:hypothetical protein